MPYVQCNTCLGEYRTVQRDGIPYFHVCPPITIVEATNDAGERVQGELRSFAGLTLVESQAQKDELVARGEDKAAIVIVAGKRAVPHVERRDERTLRHEGDRGERRILRREGAGVTVLRSDEDLKREDDDAL